MRSRSCSRRISSGERRSTGGLQPAKAGQSVAGANGVTETGTAILKRPPRPCNCPLPWWWAGYWPALPTRCRGPWKTDLAMGGNTCQILRVLPGGAAQSIPPSQCITVPVIRLDSGPAKKTTRLATSSGSPKRPCRIIRW